ncbi:Potassium channel subfamily K member 17, partial [Eschrichtius robustus]|nr:Potassium channel subfamily K member 17 [Eschrichtius robustus]
TDPSKHYISVYRSLAAIWILLGLAWLALVLPLGPLLLHRRRAREAPEGRVWGCAMPGTLLLLLAYLTYLVLGAGVFWLLESPAAHDSSERFQHDKWALLRNFTCLDGPALDSLIRGIIQAYQNGDIVLDNTTSMGRWEFVGSFFFSVSTITTIVLP